MKLTGYSTALLSTWLLLEDDGILFDAGDGVCAGLAQKTGKIRNVLITHADRDHLAGLIRLNELTPKTHGLTIHYPRDCGSFPAIQSFCERFDPHATPATWVGLEDGQTIKLTRDLHVTARINDHVPARPGQVKSLDYTLTTNRRKLRPELAGKQGGELAAIREAHGEDAVTITVEDRLLGYSGDTTALHPERWVGVKTLIHECTFLDPDTARGRHAALPQVLAAAAQLQLERLVLTHFSPRYTPAQTRNAVHNLASHHRIPYPIYLIPPGETTTDLLTTTPCWPGE